MIQFLVKDYHVWGNITEDLAPPRLPEDLQNWLDDSGITEYGLEWKHNEKASEGKHQKAQVFETHILFYKNTDGLLFKLRWYEHLQNV